MHSFMRCFIDTKYCFLHASFLMHAWRFCILVFFSTDLETAKAPFSFAPVAFTCSTMCLSFLLAISLDFLDFFDFAASSLAFCSFFDFCATFFWCLEVLSAWPAFKAFFNLLAAASLAMSFATFSRACLPVFSLALAL